jgi:hypothetical protein
MLRLVDENMMLTIILWRYGDCNTTDTPSIQTVSRKATLNRLTSSSHDRQPLPVLEISIKWQLIYHKMKFLWQEAETKWEEPNVTIPHPKRTWILHSVLHRKSATWKCKTAYTKKRVTANQDFI